MVVEKAQEAHVEDMRKCAERQAQEKESQVKKSQAELVKLCYKMDEDKSGNLSLDELLKGYDTDSYFANLLTSMDISRDDIKIIFNIMDQDSSARRVSREVLVPGGGIASSPSRPRLCASGSQRSASPCFCSSESERLAACRRAYGGWWFWHGWASSHISLVDNFPIIPRRLRGVPVSQMARRGPPERCRNERARGEQAAFRCHQHLRWVIRVATALRYFQQRLASVAGDVHGRGCGAFRAFWGHCPLALAWS